MKATANATIFRNSGRELRKRWARVAVLADFAFASCLLSHSERRPLALPFLFTLLPFINRHCEGLE